MLVIAAQNTVNGESSTYVAAPVTALSPPSTRVPSDAFLIRQICQRHEPALGILYDRYSRLIYTVALRITGDQSIAEEVVQDVFSAVWKTAESFHADGNVKSWLNGITRHRAIDTTRVRNFRAQTDIG